MFLGIDIGTSAVKAVLMDADGAPLADAAAPLAISHPRPGWSEQAPEDWWRATVTAVRAVCATHPVPVTAIGLSGQMHGAVLLDRDRAVIRPAILWNDGRAQDDCDALEQDRPDLMTVAGVRPMPGFTAPKLLWLAREEPEAHASIAHVLLPKDWIGMRLHGGLVTDPSDAAGTWWFDQAARDWSGPLCAETATDPAWLPALCDGGAVAGRLTPRAAAELGIAAGIPVAAGAGDAAAGAVAMGAVADGAGFLSLGTSGQLFLATDHYAAAPEQGLHSFAHCLPDLWFQMAALLNGARPMQWFADMTGTPLPLLLEEAAGARMEALPLFLPYLTGERTPHGDTAIRGAFYGLADETGRPEMMRAVIEAIAHAFADARDAVATARAVPSELLAIGGGARSDLLLQTMADAMGISLLRSDEAAVGPALGAARLAAHATGALHLSDLVRTPRVTARFTPRPGTQPRHRERLAAYRALYAALKPLRSVPR